MATGPYLFANLLTVAFVYSVTRANKTPGAEPLHILGLIIAIGAFMLYSMYLHGGLEWF